MEVCRLCKGSFEKLQDSHIISECFHAPLYDGKHRFVSISEDANKKLRFTQNGITESLLCVSCENKIGDWENILSRDFKAIATNSSRFLKITEPKKNLLEVEGIRYNEFKKAILSIFWRMSISNRPDFANYKFGPYNEKLRLILLNDRPLTTLQYPIFMQMGMSGNEFFPDIMMFHPRGNCEGRCSIYRVTIYGFELNLFLTEIFFRKEFELAFLRDTGSILISKYDLKELANKGAMNRVNDLDVRTIMAKLHRK